ncbi:MAG: GNAT family N-acetyltransferase [Methanothrix sp.]|jgi:ribosomal-protein-alanine N-acetyltransferase|nr:GNAT family N-acetyltransferase [Methanothrix sp.]
MKIRSAQPSDLAQIVQIEELCFPEETAFPPKMFAYLIRYAVSLVASDPEKKVLGFIMGYTSGKAGAVYTLDVHPGYRRKGIGSKLLLSLEGKLARLGAQAIRLEAAIDKPGAVELYKKVGYQERELVRNYYGRGNHAVRMWKNLDVCLCLTT